MTNYVYLKKLTNYLYFYKKKLCLILNVFIQMDVLHANFF